MSARTLRWTVAVGGVVAAIALGVTANEISNDSIGLPAKPVRPSDELAPSSVRQENEARRDARRGSSLAAPAPSEELEDRGRGRGRGRGRSGGDSGGGSGSSGGEDSSGSSSSGSGKGRSGGSEDD